MTDCKYCKVSGLVWQNELEDRPFHKGDRLIDPNTKQVHYCKVEEQTKFVKCAFCPTWFNPNYPHYKEELDAHTKSHLAPTLT